MRTPRPFRPAFEGMPGRIAPSTVMLTAPISVGPASGSIVYASIGDPTTTSTGSGSYPVILAPPPGTTPAPVC